MNEKCNTLASTQHQDVGYMLYLQQSENASFSFFKDLSGSSGFVILIYTFKKLKVLILLAQIIMTTTESKTRFLSGRYMQSVNPSSVF